MDQKVFSILTRDVGRSLYGRQLDRIASKYNAKHWTGNPKKLPLSFIAEEKALWNEMFDAHHNAYYYYNNKTKESSWVSPTDVHATYTVKTPANRTTEDFMRVYHATIKIQAIFRRKIAIRNLNMILAEAELGDGDGGD